MNMSMSEFKEGDLVVYCGPTNGSYPHECYEGVCKVSIYKNTTQLVVFRTKFNYGIFSDNHMEAVSEFFKLAYGVNEDEYEYI